MGDESWAGLARPARQALALMGKETPPCLPGEAEACGASFAQHACSYLAAMAAIIDHQLALMGPGFVACIYPDVYAATAAEIEERCQHDPPRPVEVASPDV